MERIPNPARVVRSTRTDLSNIGTSTGTALALRADASRVAVSMSLRADADALAAGIISLMSWNGSDYVALATITPEHRNATVRVDDFGDTVMGELFVRGGGDSSISLTALHYTGAGE